MALSGFLEEWHSACPYIEAHTSGSTGRPKAIRLLKTDMRQSAMATNKFFGIDSSSVLATPLSMDYIAGKMMAVRADVAGCRLIELPVSSRIELPDTTSRIDLLPIVPAQIDSLLEHSEYAARIGALLIGGAAPSAAQCRALADAGYNAFISYGMTETCSHVAIARADDPGRTFHAMPGISFESDADGCLTIVAPAFSFGRLATRDIADIVSPQEFRWRGRADGVINSGGIKLFPEELEELYRGVLGDRPYYVCAAPHPRWGQCVALILEGPADTAAIAAGLRGAIADTRRLPKIIDTVAELPRTATGKIVRRYPAP